MDLVLNWLWQGSVVALALAVLLRVLERARANVRYVVCWAALLFVIALPAVSLLAASISHPRPLVGLTEDPVLSVPTSWWTSTLLMSAAWMVWATVVGIRFARAVVALRRARARSHAFPPAVESTLTHWRRVADGGRRAQLVVSDAVASAAVLGGGGRPVIAVAPSLVATLEADELDRVVIHEWAHVQRRDDLANVLQVALRLVAGWHPAAWWIERRLHVEREMACDEATVAVTGSAKSYAACLLKLATLKGAQRTMLAAPAALGASGLRARVTRIVSGRALIAPAWSRGIAAFAVSMLCVVSVVTGGQRLVGAAALALPLEAIDAPRMRLAGVRAGASGQPGAERLAASLPPPQAPAEDVASSPRSAAPAAAVQDAREAAPAAPPPTATDAAGVPQLPAAEPFTSPVGAANDIGLAAVSTAFPVIGQQPAAPPQAAAGHVQSPWAVVAEKAADQGVVIGRTSRDAGVRTAGFFTRLAHRVADSF